MPASAGSHQGTDGGERHDLPDTTEDRHTGSDGAKRGLRAQVTAEIAAEVERLIGAGSLDGLDFEAVETAARQVALRVAGQALAAPQRRSLRRNGSCGLWLRRRGPLRL